MSFSPSDKFVLSVVFQENLKSLNLSILLQRSLLTKALVCMAKRKGGRPRGGKAPASVRGYWREQKRKQQKRKRKS